MTDPLDDALPTCPVCLRRYEIAGVTDHPELEARGVWLDERLYGVCDCGVTQLFA